MFIVCQDLWSVWRSKYYMTYMKKDLQGTIRCSQQLSCFGKASLFTDFLWFQYLLFWASCINLPWRVSSIFFSPSHNSVAVNTSITTQLSLLLPSVFGKASFAFRKACISACSFYKNRVFIHRSIECFLKLIITKQACSPKIMF